MSEKNLNFDTIIERKNTDCLKYDFAKRRGMPEQILPLWIADMDFKTSHHILDAIEERTRHGIFGYSEVQENYFETLQKWMRDQHNWKIEPEWLIKTPGVVFALAMAVQAFTKQGDGVMLQQPVYYPFSEVIADNDRRVVDNTLVLGEVGRYLIDYEDFERKVKENQVRLFLLCSPHNPVGRVWSLEELKRVGDICIRNDVLIVSDEIHQDFVFEGKHQVFAAISEKLRERTITCTAPSKTFNLAGLQVSNIFISNQKIRKKFRKQISKSGYSQLNTLGLTACEAAYRYGEEWHSGLMEYLRENINYLKSFLRDRLPQIKMTEREGTYLVWLDFRGLGLTSKEREEFIVKKAGLWLDSGDMFGPAGEGFERINIACSRAVLEQALRKLEAAVYDLRSSKGI